jgi:hypothetical protein
MHYKFEFQINDDDDVFCAERQSSIGPIRTSIHAVERVEVMDYK